MSDQQQLGLFEEFPTVQVVRSSRRRKTVEASQQNGVLRIVVPEHISKREEQHWVRHMLNVAKEKSVTSDEELSTAANELARKYRLPVPKQIRWITNQKSRWAYCDIDTESISVCEQVRTFPRWVIDYVIIHELAHLREPRHDKAFWDLVHRFPRAERARGYLIAKAEGVRDC